MKKSITLETLDTRFTKLDTSLIKLEGLIERGFGAIAHDMATKDQVIALHTQVNSIEHEIRDIKRALTKVLHQEDIDEALRRIAAIEKHLGLKAKA